MLCHAVPRPTLPLSPILVCSEVPDTFALLPRRLSDQFFSLEALVAEGVMCLGGPNFAPDALTPAGFKRHNLTAEETAFALTHRCSTQERGFSEQILKRKLQRDGIDLGKNNLGYQTFFMALVRPNMEDMCFYLEDK